MQLHEGKGTVKLDWLTDWNTNWQSANMIGKYSLIFEDYFLETQNKWQHDYYVFVHTSITFVIFCTTPDMSLPVPN